MTKKERRTIQLERHYAALSALAATVNCKKYTGKQLSCKLFLIEQFANRAAVDWANGKIQQSQYEYESDGASSRVKELFGTYPKGFFVNSDPRGYALKIDDKETRELREKGIYLQTDRGGYGLLAPTITGD